MSIIPCRRNDELQAKILSFAEILSTQAHTLGDHGLSEEAFYSSGIFRGAIERVRGQFSATMREKRDFVRHVLNFMQDRGFIQDWESSGAENRHDYTVKLLNGRTAVIEAKGCLDGNNTTIFERPPHAHEFVIWGVCTNPGADPQHNAWSGIHTRLSAEIVSRSQRVDGIIIWDMACNAIARPCPKILDEEVPRITTVGPYRLPPPCIYLLPATIPSPRNNPNPPPQALGDVELLSSFARCFLVRPEELNYVRFAVQHSGADTVRSTTVTRAGRLIRESGLTAIRRS